MDDVDQILYRLLQLMNNNILKNNIYIKLKFPVNQNISLNDIKKNINSLYLNNIVTTKSITNKKYIILNTYKLSSFNWEIYYSLKSQLRYYFYSYYNRCKYLD